MIEYDGKRWIALVTRLDGSVLPRLLGRIVFTAAVGAVAVWLQESRGAKVPPLAHTLIGVALGLLLVFRTNASYDRYWEGRKLLGGMVNRSRDLVRQVATWIPDPDRRATLRRHVAAFYGLAAQTLRKERDLSSLGPLLDDDERTRLEPFTHRAAVLSAWISRALTAEADAGRLGEQRLIAMDQNLTALHDALGGAERIMRTPIPFAYAQHIKTFVALFCFTAPFAMADSMRWFTPLSAALLAFALFGIDEIGVEIEDPFGHDANDLPLDAIGAGIDLATTEILRDAGVR